MSCFPYLWSKFSAWEFRLGEHQVYSIMSSKIFYLILSVTLNLEWIIIIVGFLLYRVDTDESALNKQADKERRRCNSAQEIWVNVSEKKVIECW